MGEKYIVKKWSEVYLPNPAMLRQIMASEGYRIYQWTDQPGCFYSWHMHPEDQSHWVVSGTLELTVKDYGTFVLEAGDRDFMPAGSYHTARVTSEEPAIYLIGQKF